MSDELFEVEVILDGFLPDVERPPSSAEPITIDRTVTGGDGTCLAYGTTTDDGMAVIGAHTTDVSHREDVNAVGRRNGGVRFELTLSDPPLVSTAASIGGYVETAVVHGNDYRVPLHRPPGADVSRVLDGLAEGHSGVELVPPRQLGRSDDIRFRLGPVFGEEFTDRQRAALSAAYYSGFFAVPRDSSGDEIADALTASASTFHRHVRRAEQKRLAALFAAAPGPD